MLYVLLGFADPIGKLGSKQHWIHLLELRERERDRDRDRDRERMMRYIHEVHEPSSILEVDLLRTLHM